MTSSRNRNRGRTGRNSRPPTQKAAGAAPSPEPGPAESTTEPEPEFEAEAEPEPELTVQDGEADDSPTRPSTTPAGSSDDQPDLWSAAEVEGNDEEGDAAPAENSQVEDPTSPEDLWLQDAVDVSDADPEPAGSPAENPTTTSPHDPESGDRWTVVDESATAEDLDTQDIDTQVAEDQDSAGDGADGQDPDVDEPTAAESFGDADAGDPPLDESGRDEPVDPGASSPQDDSSTPPEGDGAHHGNGAPVGDAAPSGRERDVAPAYPVPVTMSPKAKKFGWARESLLTGEAVTEKDPAPTDQGDGPRASSTPRGWIGRGRKTPPGSTPVAETAQGRTTVPDMPVPGTSAPVAPGPSTPVPVSSPSGPGSPVAPAPAGAPGSGSASSVESRADTPGTGTASGPVHQALHVLTPYLRTHRAALLTGSIALLLSVWLLVALPFPLKYAVDATIASSGADLPALANVSANPQRVLVISVIVLAALLVLQVIARFTAIASLGRVGVRIATALRSRLLAHLHRLRPSTGGSSSSSSFSSLSARNGGQDDEDEARPLIDDVAALRDLLSHSGPRVLAGLLTLLSLLVVTVIVEPLAALVLLVTGLLYALAAPFALRRHRTADRRAQSESRVLADTADELVSATGTIQSYGLESRSERGLTEAATRAGRALTRARRSESLVHLIAQLAAGVGVVGALLLGGRGIPAGTMTPGDLVLVLADVLILIVVLRELFQHVGALRAAPAAGDRIAALLAREAGISDPQRTQPVDRVGGEIVFSAVNTAGGPSGDLFETVSLVVPAQQHVALLDREGQESAALISYLLRFDQPDTGRVLLDRFDTRTVSLTDLRRQIAVVQREPVLFTDTVRENIRIGRPDATDAEVLQAARRAGVDEVIGRLGSGYDTVLVRRGNVLTDGQRRRIAIARAMLRDAPIVVLDAADADLSTAERQPVLAALAALVEGRTAIVSSRDPETITGMDRVLWFERGDVREDGAPSALAADADSRLAAWLRTQDEIV